jgi:hypothetical protein
MFGQSIGITWMVWSLVTVGGTVSPCSFSGSSAPSPPSIAERMGPCIVAYDLALVPTLELLWQRSSTYRHQCEYLASRRAIVSLKLDLRGIEYGHRAMSSVGRLKDGRIVVQSRIGASGPLAELVAHELEHALEFSEGVNFLAGVARGNVWRSRGGRFETKRADDAGRQAAAEVRRARPVLAARTAPLGSRAAAQCGP